MIDETFAVEIWDIERVKPYEKNPRINDDAVEAVVASIEEFGFRQSIVVDSDGVIICGHTRWKAARKLGLKRVPVHVATDLSPDQVKAYRLADNRTGEIAKWDFEILPIEIADLQNAGFDMELLGFDDRELSVLLEDNTTEGNCDPNEVPEPPDDLSCLALLASRENRTGIPISGRLSRDGGPDAAGTCRLLSHRPQPPAGGVRVADRVVVLGEI